MHLPDAVAAGPMLVQAPANWIDWRIEVGHGSGRPAELVDEARAVLACEPSGWVEVDRERRTSTLRLPGEPEIHELVQPRLGITAVMVAHWQKRHSFHAGAFVVDGVAWGVLGSRGAGKSSLLATLALMGVPVLADDVLVVDERRRALAGPRCVDLRREAASALGAGESIGVVGTRERWRVGLEPVQCEAPLGGFVRLEWGEPGASLLPAERRVRALHESFALLIGERRDPTMLAALMELFALPMVCLRRPAELASIGESARMLLDTVGQLTAQPV